MGVRPRNRPRRARLADPGAPPGRRVRVGRPRALPRAAVRGGRVAMRRRPLLRRRHGGERQPSETDRALPDDGRHAVLRRRDLGVGRGLDRRRDRRRLRSHRQLDRHFQRVRRRRRERRPTQRLARAARGPAPDRAAVRHQRPRLWYHPGARERPRLPAAARRDQQGRRDVRLQPRSRRRRADAVARGRRRLVRRGSALRNSRLRSGDPDAGARQPVNATKQSAPRRGPSVHPERQLPVRQPLAAEL